MKRLALAAGVLLAGPALAASFTNTTYMLINGVTDLAEATVNSTASVFDDRVVRDARDDAAQFVASGGQVRSARLQAALAHIRARLELAASDLQLAEAIVAR